jgi:hypothetical protein
MMFSLFDAGCINRWLLAGGSWGIAVPFPELALEVGHLTSNITCDIQNMISHEILILVNVCDVIVFSYDITS